MKRTLVQKLSKVSLSRQHQEQPGEEHEEANPDPEPGSEEDEEPSPSDQGIPEPALYASLSSKPPTREFRHRETARRSPLTEKQQRRRHSEHQDETHFSGFKEIVGRMEEDRKNETATLMDTFRLELAQLRKVTKRMDCIEETLSRIDGHDHPTSKTDTRNFRANRDPNSPIYLPHE
ncbi:hypothetical protein L211DRAFT_850369 [Terfezia boudieri ATCC MYA-4762]|uniref:Uncharacterized protein n=1 Tax=Terfezia boudieri ATCC MYA-4762 TaxID=1051890 RepID=A0A3N4LNT2_9PEZI|nr:hypothetical protein L211DRAFT_850369 [Terfezia boudieri ATCC MYA-4762]